MVRSSSGQYVLHIDMDPPTELFSTWDIEVAIPKEKRLTYEKGKRIRIQGVISDIGQELLPDCSIKITATWPGSVPAPSKP